MERQQGRAVPTRRAALAGALLGALLAGTAGTAGSAGAAPARTGKAASHSRTNVRVIVRHAPGADAAAGRAVTRVGGRVERELAIADAIVATVPDDRMGELRAAAGVRTVTPDAKVHLLSDPVSSPSSPQSTTNTTDLWRADKDLGSLYTVEKSSGVDSAWKKRDMSGRSITGKGVTVALIDSGVVPVNGLTLPGKVVNGPDLSFQSQTPQLQYLDTFGHGTHLAGIIAGRDVEVRDDHFNDPDEFVGVAPDARILNVKVASSDGATDVSQVIAAIDWVVQHRTDNGMNVRVLNLSFGTDSVQPYGLDPLAYAVEVAWRKGIVVVVAAGNGGPTTTSLNNPATDPFVIAVGALDQGTANPNDDTIATFTSAGSSVRPPDLVAPGRSLVSLRNPGSMVDGLYPSAVVTDRSGNARFFRGTGTSQATAFVSGVAALVVQRYPTITPDQVKKLLTSTAVSLSGVPRERQGAGRIDVDRAINAAVPSVAASAQTWPYSTGTGSLEASRGSAHVIDPITGLLLTGEQDIFGMPWDGSSWSGSSWSGSSWSGGTWNGSSWSGSSWSGSSWSGSSWSGSSWSGSSWSGSSWSGSSWSGSSWSGSGWSGSSWSGNGWSGSGWSGSGWSGSGWSGSGWSGSGWSGAGWLGVRWT